MTARATPEDLARWRTLIAEADKAVKAPPSTALPGLKRAADAARRAVVPSGELNDANPAIRLVRLSRRYLAETTAGRRDLQDALGAAVQAARAAMPDAPERREPRKRADLDE